MKKRRRFTHTQSLEERLADEAMRLRAEAKKLPPSGRKEALLRKARHDDTTANLTEWLLSSGPRAPI